MKVQEKFRILVIDDNPAIHDDFRKILSVAQDHLSETEEMLFGDSSSPVEVSHVLPDIELDSAFQGKEGADKVIQAKQEGRPYSVAFVDFRMPPGWDGVQTIQAFWEIDQDIQVVICSAYSDYSWVEIMEKIGQSDRLIILKKPFDNIEVRQLATTLTRKWRLSQDLHQQMNNLEKLVDDRTAELKNALSISTATLESTSDGILVVSENNNILNYNARFLDMWRIPDELVEKGDMHLLLDYMRNQMKNSEKFSDALNSVIGSPRVFVTEVIRSDGRVFELQIYPYTVDQVKTGLLYSFRDITQRKIFEKELTYEATHDYLTGLPNRLLLVDRLRQSILYGKRHDKLVGVVYIDLDRFKYINDTLGHAIGDGMLQAVAGRIRINIREMDTLSRLGGDEFVMVIADMDTEEDLQHFISRILDSLEEPFYLAEHEVRITASIGVSVYPKDGDEPDVLLTHADTALYHVKEDGRGSCQFYAPGMSDNSHKLIEMEKDLRVALERNELFMEYQPIIKGNSRTIAGVEALLRWQHPTLGRVSPADFIPTAEKSGLIVPIGEWILETVKKQLLEWQALDLPPIYAAVNISGIQLKHPNFLNSFTKILERMDIDPTLIEFELTESILLEQSSHILASLMRFKEMGIKIVLDDFGTGYSSLTYLRRFPVDKIKIERAFIGNLDAEEDSLAIVSAIIAMAHKLGLNVVAEGVENEETVALLKENACDYMQGYLFSQSVSGDKIATLLAKEKGSPIVKPKRKTFVPGGVDLDALHPMNMNKKSG